MVQIGLFAQGGRRVRCARCKHEWHASLPTNIDVVMPVEDIVPIPSALQRPAAVKKEQSAPLFSRSESPKEQIEELARSHICSDLEEKDFQDFCQRAFVYGVYCVAGAGACFDCQSGSGIKGSL